MGPTQSDLSELLDAFRSRPLDHIENRQPNGRVIQSDQGTQHTSWAFTRRALDSGLVLSMGSVGDRTPPITLS